MQPAPTFEDRCRAVAIDAGLVPSAVIVGAQNVVIVCGDRILRFPRRSKDASRIGEFYGRHLAAYRLGLAAARPLGWRDGAAGTAHLQLARVGGTPLPDFLRSGAADGSRLGVSLVAVLQGLRSVGSTDWPFPQRGWIQLWEDLAHHARAHPLPPAEASAWIDAADHAAEVARRAPLGLVHGDLQGGNVIVRADGCISAVIDWDSAVIGDPAMDTAAALHDLPERLRREMIQQDRGLADDLRRFECYQATWPLQTELWRQSDGTWPLPAVDQATPSGRN